MFGYNDKVTLTLMNASDTDGNLLPLSLKLPVSQDSEYVIPDNLASVDVFEYQEGMVNNGIVVFSIFVGEKSTIEDLAEMNDDKRIQLRSRIEIPAINSDVCYQVVGDRRKVFAVVEENDVVVSDHQELRDVIGRLSDDYTSFCHAVQKIKYFGKREK